MKKQLLIIATLDTKGREAKHIRNCAIKLGAHPVVREGMPLFDLSTFTKKLLNPNNPFEEMHIHLNDSLFAKKAVEILDRMVRGSKFC